MSDYFNSGIILGKQSQIAVVIPACGDDCHNIGIHLETGAFHLQIVCNHIVAVLLCHFFPGTVDQVLCFHGKADQCLAFFLLLAERSQNILCAFQFNGQISVFLVHFVVRDIFRPVVRYCRREDHDIHLRRTFHYRLIHIFRRYDMHGFYSIDIRQAVHACHNRNFGPGVSGGSCQRVPHLARTVIGQETYRIQCFLGRSGCNKNLLSLQELVFAQHFIDFVFNILRFRHSSLSDITAGKITVGTVHDFHAVMSAFCDIVLRYRIFQHIDIHCRHNQFRTGAGQECRCEHVIRNPIGYLCNNIRTCRGNDKQIRLLCQRYMVYFGYVINRKHIRNHLLSAQRLECQRRDKFLSRFRHQHMHFMSLFLQRRNQRTDFICRNPAGHTYKNTFVFCHYIHLSSSLFYYDPR